MYVYVGTSSADCLSADSLDLFIHGVWLSKVRKVWTSPFEVIILTKVKLNWLSLRCRLILQFF